MNWYLKVINNYRDFGGRSRRKEYWMFVLFNIMFSTGAILLDNLFDITWSDKAYGPLYSFYGLIIILPNLAVLVRRLHDIGKSGWYLFAVLIPVIGFFWLLILLLTDSNPGENEYGINPKEVQEAF